MKSKKSTAAGTASGAAQIEAYLAKVAEPARTILMQLRALIRSTAPAEATEAMSYGIPAFHYHGPLVGYAAFKNHCGFYVMDGTLLEAFAEELKGYETAKGTVRFPLDQLPPATLLKKLVKAKVAENEARARSRSGRG